MTPRQREGDQPLPVTHADGHPDCACGPDMPEGAYSMDCAHHRLAHERMHAEMRARLSGGPPSPALDLAAVQDILSRRRYRPGWKLAAYVGDTTRLVHIEIDAMVEDSYNPGNQTRLHVVSIVPPFLLREGELAFDKWLANRMIMLEVHESQEWYQRPGRDLPWVPVFNPHLDGADRDRWPIAKRGETA